LEKAVQSPLVTVVAGAGYGKTYGVYSFVDHYDAVTIWIQLSERDNLGTRFWENFVKAVGFIAQETADKLAVIGFPETKRQFERYVAVPYTDVIPNRKYIFVYDDFHLIHNEAVLRFLERSITTPFGNITSILISRTEPEINTLSLFAKGLLAKITEEDLRFSQKEMIDYFHIQDIRLSPEAAASIYRDTEGWAFAIHLTGLSLKKGLGNSDYARSSMKINIFKLIEREIFFDISPELQQYLIKLSLIEHWSLELLTELADKPELIEQMKRISSFIRYDVYLSAYQIHPLFLKYLSNKQPLLTDQEKREVYRKAAVWCMKNDLKMDAMSYYEKAGNYDEIISIAFTMPQIMPKDVAQFLLDMFDRAPHAMYGPNGGTYALHSRLLLVLGRFNDAIEKSKATIEQFKALPLSPHTCRVLYGNYNVLGFIGTLQCLYTQRYDFDHYFEQAGNYYPLSGIDVSNPLNNICIGSYICRVGGPEKEQMDQFIEAVVRSIPFVSVNMNGCLYGYDDLARAELAYFREELDNAEKYALTALYKAREKKQYEIEARALFYLLRMNLASGNYDDIQDILKQLESQLQITEYSNRHVLYDIITGWFYAQIGHISQIPAWLKNDFEANDLHSLIHGMESLIKIKYQLSEKRYPAALATMENQYSQYGSVHAFLLGKILLRAYEAICRYQLKEKDKACKALETAYALSAPNGLDMLFIELGKDMRALAGSVLKDEACGVPRAWLEKINRKSAAYSKKLGMVIEKYHAREQTDQRKPPLEVLSRRELAILTGLSEGLTREELADISALSINTVKSVIKSVYTKLNAVNRADAIRIATTMGILKK
ncbi:MAG: LuxR C-terminal-related transcriptional regulator, partial [Treponema sp.]|nr:LuxR C-terminal-related transcriptional regulator [Treponema sp.]